MKQKIFLLFLLTILSLTVFSQTTVIENVNLIDVSTGEVIPNQSVVIEGEKIVQTGATAAISYAAGAKVIDGGKRAGVFFAATLLEHVDANQKIYCPA